MIATGIDRLITDYKHLKKLQLGLVTNDVATTAVGVPARKALQDAGFQLVKLFSPEHGLGALGEDGVAQADFVDPLTGLPVVSLYGSKMAPEPQDLDSLDAVLFDIPDVGCRFYTYLWTLTYVMEGCARERIPLFVLDRPNPLGADLSNAEGPLLDEAHCTSFIGRWSIPIRHSCTLGELALYFASTRLPGADVKVIPVEGWDRSSANGSCTWTFKPTSPAIRDLETAFLYPGTGLLEGIYINEGRGAPRPFTCCGAPWINGSQLADAFNNIGLPGIVCHPVQYVPDNGIYEGENCNGISFQISYYDLIRPVHTALTLIRLLFQLYPGQVKERSYYTAANPTGAGHLDKLTGVRDSFRLLSAAELSGSAPTLMDTSVNNWKQQMEKFLLY